jgi:ribosomal protein S4E
MAISDVRAVTLAADGTVNAGRARVRQIQVKTAGTGSPQIILKDGGASGTTLIDLAFGTSDTFSVNIPDNGILFETDVYLDLTNCLSVTVFLS